MHARCSTTIARVLILLALAAPGLAASPGAGTLTLRTPSAPEGVESLAVATDVRISVTGIVARAEVTQAFSNPGTEWAEGIYAFPLPENAAVDHLRMIVGERVIEGEIHEREAAKKQYEAAKAAGSHAALLEQERPNLFTTSVANIAPGDDVTVTIEYQQVLRLDAGSVSLRFPMTLTPRFTTGTEDDAARITPPMVPPNPDASASGSVTIEVALDAGVPIASLACPSHEITADAPDDTQRVVRLAAPAQAVRDFELTWTLEPKDAPRAAVFVEHHDGADHLLLLVVPPEEGAARHVVPREVIFVVDTSGSMGGTSIEQARAALEDAIARLEPGARFNLIQFNSGAWAHWEQPQAVTDATRTEAIEWARSLQATGGTRIGAALDLALDGKSNPGRVRQIVFMTDGAVGNEDELFGLIDQRLGDSRLFTIGIGSAPNSWFMTKAAETGRGTYTYVGSVDEVREKMTALFAKLETAVMTDLSIEWPAGAEVEAWPGLLPDLYAGEPLVVSAAIGEAKGWVRITGLRGDEEWSQQVDLEDASEGHGLGVLWARAKIASLTDQLHRGVSEDEVRASVVEVALEHHLVSKYTSLVAVERTPVRPEDEALLSQAVPLLAPEGSVDPGNCLPACATSWRFDLALGLALMTAALMGMVVLRPGRVA